MKHTPGSWFAIKHPDGAWTVQDQEHGAGTCVAMRYGDSSYANAYLIAAAPELLEALEWAMKQSGMSYTRRIKTNEYWCDQVDKARAAIAKARGETE